MLSLALIALWIFSSHYNVIPAQAQTATEQVRISDIKVTGNRRVAEGTVLSYLPVQVGDLVSQGALSQSLERLFATNLFKDLKLDLDGSVLLVTVVENPIVNRVSIEGNDVISDERLLEVIDVQPRRVYDRQLALDAAAKLLNVYRAGGRFGAVVEPKIIELNENRVDLVFEVDEGPLIKIETIVFSGNKNFSDAALTQAIVSRERRWWAFLTPNDKYDEGRLDYDVRLLRQFYLSRGYADINVSRARGGLLPDRSGFALTFLINEGVRYKVNDIKISSQIENIDLEALRDLMKFDDDQWYDVRQLEQGLLDVSNQLGVYGYAFVDVTPQIVTDPSTGLLDIEVSIGQARRNFVERIEFIDNTRTLDRVIRREFELVEGDAFNQLKLDRSVRNVRNLGYFSKVDVQNLQGSSADQTITRVTVEEQSTGDFSIGVGYSSLDKTSFTLGINERNFLGTGRRASASISTSDTSTDFVLGLSQPYLFGRDLTGSIDLFKTKSTANLTAVNRTGVDLGVRFSAARDIYHRVSYELATSKITNTSTVATSLTGENGKSLLKSAVSYTIGRDTRDSRFDPTEGMYAEISETFSGVGGDVTFLRTNLRAGYYKPFLFKSVVLGLKGRVGNVSGLGDDVTQSERFFLGGQSVRGFDSNGIGPRDTGSKAAVGGNNVYNGTVEIVSNLGVTKDAGIRWTVFSDFGSVWETDFPSGVTEPNDQTMRSSVGVGLLWNTAIGPLSFYWAKPINEAKHDNTKTFQFSIGTRL
ncbi:MAG: outer membrane protein assembly factor BamA [Candidatus Puniceispirillum sp.]|nr:outer membrane protein assembly factor BamA [Candidatus Puniceispirillum sp.]